MSPSRLLALACAALILSACGSSEPATSRSSGPGGTRSGEATREVSAAVDRARSAFNDAQADGLSFYAPRRMRRASKQLRRLRRATEEGDKESALARAQATLSAVQEARAHREEVEASLRPLLRRLHALEDYGATETHPSAYKKARVALRELARALESGDEVEEKRQAAEKTLADLRAQVVGNYVLGPIKAKLRRLEKLGGEELAPASTRKARAAVQDLEAALRSPAEEASHRDIRRLSAVARARAEWAEYVARRVRHLKGLSARKLEQEVVEHTTKISAIETAAQAFQGDSTEGAAPSLAEGIERRRSLWRVQSSGQSPVAPSLAGVKNRLQRLPPPGTFPKPPATTPGSALPTKQEMRSFPVSDRLEPTYEGGIAIPTVETSGFRVGVLQTPGGKTVNFVRNALVLRAGARSKAEALAKRWNGRVLAKLPYEGGAASRYVVQVADLLKSAPTQKELQAAVHGIAPGAPTGPYRFSSDHARGLFWIAVQETHARGHAVEILWLLGKESLQEIDLTKVL